MDSLATLAHRFAAPTASVGWLRHPRLEPLFNVVRGRRPEPLDEGSVVFFRLTRLRGGCYYTAAFPILKRKLY